MTECEFKLRIEKYSKGDNSSFDIIFNEYYHKLVGAAFLILHNKEESQNVAGDIFERMLRNPFGFTDIRSPSAFLFTITQNQAKSVLRRQLFKFEDSSTSVGDFSEEVADRIDYYKLLENHFTEAEQEMLILRTVWDYTYLMIAKKLKLPLGTIKTKFRNFKRRLKGVLR